MMHSRTPQFALAATFTLVLLAGLTAGCGSSSDSGSDAAFAFRADAPSTYARIDRMGMPAVNTVLISSKDPYNAADPSDDVSGTFVSEIVNSLNGLHGALDDDLTNAGLTPCTAPGDGTGTCVAQGAPLIVPDSINVATAQPSGFPNGRRLPDPVIDLTLAVILLDLSTHGVTTLADLPLNPPANDVPFQSSFPYLAPAQP